MSFFFPLSKLRHTNRGKTSALIMNETSFQTLPSFPETCYEIFHVLSHSSYIRAHQKVPGNMELKDKFILLQKPLPSFFVSHIALTFWRPLTRI